MSAYWTPSPCIICDSFPLKLPQSSVNKCLLYFYFVCLCIYIALITLYYVILYICLDSGCFISAPTILSKWMCGPWAFCLLLQDDCCISRTHANVSRGRKAGSLRVSLLYQGGKSFCRTRLPWLLSLCPPRTERAILLPWAHFWENPTFAQTAKRAAVSVDPPSTTPDTISLVRLWNSFALGTAS